MQFELNKKQKSEGSGGKRYKLELSTIGWVASIAVLLIGVTWVFIFGVLVGRGYRPEQTVPELARIMPSENRTNATSANNEVLKAEELQFYDSLKEGAPKQAANDLKPAAEAKEQTAAQAKPQQQAQAAPKQAQATKAATTTPAQTAAKQQTAAAAPKKNDLLTPPEPAPTNEPAHAAAQAKKPQATAAKANTMEGAGQEGDQQVYDYVYQIAAFADSKAAESFRTKVAGLGFKSYVMPSKGENKTWHRVLVQFRGRPEDTRELKAKLAGIGVDRTILRQKKPI
ncbi:SPOR domain-containing protein [Oceanidesulfovibrio marinus]|uniref:SPOR domain-containing protein n=1 Tax=Oceanidesulfovibrio marinus TaxID=370038 RepID=A0A6P1ZHC5_9BACT|nr:SPOR domain-containing protein [Oceanidesulfovibrio marinus]QJT07527.1 SPOR domain-containing protein [Oceanidesulfovibrio marinus]TVM34559.1 hypothetical protein DQK91_08270 [Oceanidesulfovibrio marinus]